MKLHGTSVGRVGLLLVLVGTFSTSHAQQIKVNTSEQEGTDNVLEIVIVTAQKVSQSIQEVAAAVSAMSGETLDNIGATEMADIQSLVPSIRLQRQSSSTEIYIRGVGTTLDLPMIESPNAFNINGIYIPREAASASIFDISRIEVLPGPQGTLYGRGALGGTINLITNRPGDEFESSVMLEVGNYSLIRGTATLNVPVSDKLAMRVAVSGNYRDGYLKSGAKSSEDIAGLVSLDWHPNDDFSLFLWTHLEDKGGYADNLMSKGSFSDPKSQAFPHPDNPWNDLLDGDLEVYASLGPIDKQPTDWQTMIFGAELNWNINEHMLLTYIPSYLYLDWDQSYWITHKISDFGEEIKQTTHELRLSYDAGGNLEWLAGLYAYRFETDGYFFIKFGPNELGAGPTPFWLNANDIQNHVLKGVAMFGQATYTLTDNLRLVFGGRMSFDDRKANGFVPGLVKGTTEPSREHINPFTGMPNYRWENADKWDNLDWKLGIEFDSGENSLLYATIQTGFQPGTFDTVPGRTTKQSELLAFSAGTKNTFLDGRLIVNDELYYYDYVDLLTQAWDAATASNRLTNTDATIYGNQFDLSYLPRRSTQFKLSVGYVHARYDDFVTAVGDFTDYQMQYAPTWTVILGFVQDWDLQSSAYLRFQLNSRYSSGFWGDFSHSPGIYQAPYSKTDVLLAYHAANEAWSLGVWVRNIGDQDVQAASAPGSLYFDPAPGATYLEAPRTYGIRFTANF